jgi:hypothetical protein
VDWLELLRSDVRAEKVALLTEAMKLSDADGQIFWPIYREYQKEFAGIEDQRIALLKDYTRSFSVMDDDKAKDIADQWFRLQEDKMKLKKKYFKKVEKAMSTIMAARFVQIEHQLGLLIDLQITAQLPLIRPLKGSS